MKEEIIYCKRPYVVINDSGYYFDNFNSFLEGDIIKNSSYEELRKTEIKNQVFILSPAQDKELKYLSSLFLALVIEILSVY